VLTDAVMTDEFDMPNVTVGLVWKTMVPVLADCVLAEMPMPPPV